MARLSAYQFGSVLPGPTGRPRYSAGVKTTAEALRALASRIESGEVLVHEVEVASRAVPKDFVRTVLTMTLTEREEG